MFSFIDVALARINECFDIKGIRSRHHENRKQAKPKQNKSSSEKWLEFRAAIVQCKQMFFLDRLEQRIILMIICVAIWLANVFNSLYFSYGYTIGIDMAFWIVKSSFCLIPAPLIILLLLGILLIICVVTAKLKQKMENTGIKITNKKLYIVLINYYCAIFLEIFFTTFITSQCIYVFQDVNWIPVLILVIDYNIFLLVYSSFSVYSIIAFDRLLTKFCDYIINDVKTPDEISV
jgi:hypothetical protein